MDSHQAWGGGADRAPRRESRWPCEVPVMEDRQVKQLQAGETVAMDQHWTDRGPDLELADYPQRSFASFREK